MIIEVFDSAEGYPDGLDHFITAQGEFLERIGYKLRRDGILQVVLERGTERFPSHKQVSALEFIMTNNEATKDDLVCFYALAPAI